MDLPQSNIWDTPPSTLPPSYTPSSCSVPPYSTEPSSDEESLEVATRPRTPTPRGVFTAKAGDVTVSLDDQEFGAGIPTYRQNAIIKGHVEIASQAVVTAVSIKLEGRQKCTISDIGTQDRLLFSETHQLWTRPSHWHNVVDASPLRLDFHVPFPFKFVDKAYTDPLVSPPSFDIRLSGEPGISAKNEYILVTTVTTARPDSGTKHDSPRSRPYLPIPNHLLPFFSTFKTAPEEWHQITFSVPCKDGTQKPMDCHLFIPHAQIYALRDTIPYHLQLRASVDSLRLFSGEPMKHATMSLELPSTASPNPSGRPPTQTSPTPLHHSASSPVAVRVYIRRQVSVMVKGERAYQGLVIGEGTLNQVEYPPEWSPASTKSPPSNTGFGTGEEKGEKGEKEYSLDWEGEVRCDEHIVVPSFVSGSLHVRDYIVVHLRPADMRVAAHIEHRYSHAIRLVTDKYRDVHPSDR
ncbi:hypothetical protein BDY19DRAFT_517415 [Irpex rosettiformis]|uniref:Uncharacterized protein n=1 Tax=Irpex rosettiformis TaxID=378272 RepID=A0ACB8TRR1_9APHY|nr:hypothetical protein BDY19DRAFT_517415 [Irpex rosettiformis]